MHKKQCKGCDVPFFVAIRSDAVTCSPRCRQRYKRMCDKIAKECAALGVGSCGSCGIQHNPSQLQCHVCGSRDLRGSNAVPDRNSVCPVVAQADELSGDHVDLSKCQRCGSRVSVVNGCCRACFEREMFGEDD